MNSIVDKLNNEPSIVQLANILQAEAKKPNVLTAAQLIRFMPVLSPAYTEEFLAAHGPDGHKKLHALKNEFIALTPRLYSPTIVVASEKDATEVYVFPPRFAAPVQTIKPSVDATVASGANTNATQRDPDSRQAEQTLSVLLTFFDQAQMEPEHIRQIAEARKVSEDIVRRMAIKQGKADPVRTDATTGPNVTGGAGSIPASVMDVVEFDLD